MEALVEMIISPMNLIRYYRTEHTILPTPIDSESNNNVEKPNFIQKYPYENTVTGRAPKLALITNAYFNKRYPKEAYGSTELIRKCADKSESLMLLAIESFQNEDQLMRELSYKKFETISGTLGDDEECLSRNQKWYDNNKERIGSMPENFLLSKYAIGFDRKIFTLTNSISSKFQLCVLDDWYTGILFPVLLQELRSRILELSLDELIICCKYSKDRTGVTLCMFLALDVVPVVLKEFYAENETVNFAAANSSKQLDNLTNKITNFLLHTIRLHFSPQMCEDWAENGLKELIRLDILQYDVKSDYSPSYEWEGGDLKKLYDDYVAKLQ